MIFVVNFELYQVLCTSSKPFCTVHSLPNNPLPHQDQASVLLSKYRVFSIHLLHNISIIPCKIPCASCLRTFCSRIIPRKIPFASCLRTFCSSICSLKFCCPNYISKMVVAIFGVHCDESNQQTNSVVIYKKEKVIREEKVKLCCR